MNRVLLPFKMPLQIRNGFGATVRHLATSLALSLLFLFAPLPFFFMLD